MLSLSLLTVICVFQFVSNTLYCSCLNKLEYSQPLPVFFICLNVFTGDADTACARTEDDFQFTASDPPNSCDGTEGFPSKRRLSSPQEDSESKYIAASISSTEDLTPKRSLSVDKHVSTSTELDRFANDMSDNIIKSSLDSVKQKVSEQGEL